MNWWLRARVQQEDLGDFDTAGAMADIVSGLGFEATEEEENGGAAGDTGSGTGGELGSEGEGEQGGTGEGDQVAGETKPAGEGEEQGQTKPVTTAEAAPKTWRAEAQKEWDKLSPVVKQEIAKREEDMFKGMEQYRNDASFGKTIQQVLDPFVPILQQHGINPIQQIGDLMNAHKTLALGSPEAKVGMLRWLAKEYSIDLGGLGGGPAAEAGQEGYVDPAVKGLQDKLQSVESRLQQDQEAREAEARAKATSDLQAFRADPEHVYFDELVTDITQLMRSGICSNLKQAYDRAVYSNPVTRDKEIARKSAEADRLKKEQDAAKAAQAKKALGANVRTTAKKGSAAASVGTIDDTLNETYDRLTSKA